MKVIFSVILIVISFYLHAQCVPDVTITTPGIYPDTTTNLQPAVVGTAYNEVIQIRVLTDTVYNGLPATIQKIEITNISGLPSGFVYACNPSNCEFPGGSNGCVAFTGNPNASQVGTYPLLVFIDVTGNVQGIPFPITVSDTVEGYKIVITPVSGIPIIKNKNIELYPNYPNPVVNSTSIIFDLQKPSSVEFKLYNTIGKEILSKDIEGKTGRNVYVLDARELEGGIYIYSVKTGASVLTRRLVVSKR